MEGSDGVVICPFIVFWVFNLLLQRFGHLSRMDEETCKLQGALMWSKDRGWEP